MRHLLSNRKRRVPQPGGGVSGEESFPVALGRAVHREVADAVTSAKKLKFRAKPNRYDDERLQHAVKLVWDYTLAACKTAFLKAKASQPYASEEDVVATALPFFVEHRLDGSLVGCSEIIAVDCYDYLRNIIFDVKVGSQSKGSRLYTTGYALVMESLYEIPVDIGCTVYINFKSDRLVLSKDLHYIDANLRSWWIEERDKKAELVHSETDPGRAENCPQSCMYREYCL